jgi:serine/threonine protein kinase
MLLSFCIWVIWRKKAYQCPPSGGSGDDGNDDSKNDSDIEHNSSSLPCDSGAKNPTSSARNADAVAASSITKVSEEALEPKLTIDLDNQSPSDTTGVRVDFVDPSLLAGRFRLKSHQMATTEGAETIVLFATNEEIKETVAIKFFKRKIDRDHSCDLLEKTLKNDPRFVATLYGSKAESVFDDPSAQPHYPFAMVMHAGTHDLQTLLDRRGKQPFEEEVWELMIKRIMKCVEFMHTCGVVHCDLKPKNVVDFSSGQGQPFTPRLIGFDNARKIGETWTGTSSVVCAPEAAMAHIKGKALKVRQELDVWALGCIFWQVIHGTSLLETLINADVDEDKGFHAIAFITQDEIDEQIQILEETTSVRMKNAASLLRKILIVDPDSRPSVSDLLGYSLS